ncbi:MAG: tetratricopeptide repeat protein [Brevinematales bacterium]|nr:tetratricopeptide repeat protein [Brevinematales bacterium]
MPGFPKLSDDILIIVLAVIAALLVGIIVFIILRLLTTKRTDHEIKRLVADKRYDDAIAKGEDYLKNHKPDFAILVAMGEAHDTKGNLQSALKYFTDASLMVHGNKPVYHSIVLRMARMCEKLGRNKDALSYYLMILEADGSNAEVLYEIALYHYDHRNMKKAREFLEQLLRLKPGLIDARFIYGKTLFETGNYASAIKQFELLEKYDPANGEVYFYKGRCLENLKQYHDASAAYETYLSFEGLVPDQKERAMIAQVQSMLRAKEHKPGAEKAESFLRGEVSGDAKKELLYLFANLKKELGEEFEAIMIYDLIAKIDPLFRDAGTIAQKYEKLLPHTAFKQYFISDEGKFDDICKKMLDENNCRIIHRSVDQYIYLSDGRYTVFFRHIDPINYAQMSAIESVITLQRGAFGGCEIYAVYGTDSDTSVHPWRKTSALTERESFLRILKKALET